MAVLTVIVEKRRTLGSPMSRTCDHNITYKCVLISLFYCYCGALWCVAGQRQLLLVRDHQQYFPTLAQAFFSLGMQMH